MEEFDRVTAVVKAVRMDVPTGVTGGQKKQEVMVSDSKKAEQVTTYEEKIETMVHVVGKSYKMAEMMVHSFGPENYKETYLPTEKQSCTNDIADVITAVEV